MLGNFIETYNFTGVEKMAWQVSEDVAQLFLRANSRNMSHFGTDPKILFDLYQRFHLHASFYKNT